MSGSASMVWAVPFTFSVIRAMGACLPGMAVAAESCAIAQRPPGWLVGQCSDVLTRQPIPIRVDLEHPLRQSATACGPVSTRYRPGLAQGDPGPTVANVLGPAGCQGARCAQPGR